MRTVLAGIKLLDSEATMLDIANNSSRHTIDWEEVCDGTGHDENDTMAKVISMWRENQVKKLNKSMAIVESRKKIMEDNRKGTMGMIAKADHLGSNRPLPEHGIVVVWACVFFECNDVDDNR
jgi:hypothetical protein